MNIAYVPKSSVPTRLALGWQIIEGAPHPASWAVLMQIPEMEVDTPVPFIPEPMRGSTKSRGARSRNKVRYAGCEH
jgi:hypothetical protein